jgi:MoxR-like ATPase
MDKELAFFTERMDRLRAEVGKVLVGQKAVVDGVLTCLVADGHVLLEGVPGLGKTLLVRTLAQCLGLTYRRIQFTPDLMPADIVGTHILNEDESGRRKMEFQHGPSSPRSCSPTRSTAPRPRRSPRCSRPCRSARSPSMAPATRSRGRSS